MITSAKLQPLYNNLYTHMRKYVWDYSTVVALVDVEMETYRSFPDMGKLKKYTADLKSHIVTTSAYKTDDEFRQSVKEFEDSINDADALYAGIVVFKEVVCSEDS